MAGKYSKTISVVSAAGPGGLITQQERWIVDVEGLREPLVFTSDPTDDEIIARLPAEARLKGSNLADRVEAVAELAVYYNALRAASADTAFTAQERTRLGNAADLVAQRIRGLV